YVRRDFDTNDVKIPDDARVNNAVARAVRKGDDGLRRLHGGAAGQSGKRGAQRLPDRTSVECGQDLLLIEESEFHADTPCWSVTRSAHTQYNRDPPPPGLSGMRSHPVRV